MTLNELDPAMLAQAQMLGQQRTPTKTEQLKMREAQMMMAALQVSGTTLSSFLEGGHGRLEQDDIDFAVAVSKAVLTLSSQTKDEENVMLRKLRNQLGAQIVYSAVRGGKGEIFSYDATALVKAGFDAAASLLTSADEFSKEKVESEEATGSDSSIILTP